MKTKRLLLALSCLLFFTGMGYAQGRLQMEQQLSPAAQWQLDKEDSKFVYRSQWNGLFTYRMMRDIADLQDIMGITDEQLRQIREIRDSIEIRNEFYQTPEFRAMKEEENAFMRSSFMQNADEETRVKIISEFRERDHTTIAKLQTEAIEKLLTTEQKRQIQEYQLALMSSASWRPFGSLHALEVLNLTDVQKQEIERIKKEFDPEFEKSLEVYVNASKIVSDKFNEARRQEGGGDMRAIQARLLAEDSEYKKRYDEMRTVEGAFMTQFRLKVFDVLTDEQWDRLLEIVDHPPLTRMRAERAGIWVPGPGSWRPGMPVPEEYRQRRNTERRFPQPVNQ